MNESDLLSPKKATEVPKAECSPVVLNPREGFGKVWRLLS